MASFSATGLHDILRATSEERVFISLSSLFDSRNSDTLNFLTNESITFSKAGIAKTYLVFDTNPKTKLPIGFFALTSKSILIDTPEIQSKAFEKRIGRFVDHHIHQDIYMLNTILIAQFGRNFLLPDNYYSDISIGNELMECAINKIVEIQYDLGGCFVCVECEDIEGLISFYETNGFRRFQNRKLSLDSEEYLVQMIRYISPKYTIE